MLPLNPLVSPSMLALDDLVQQRRFDELHCRILTLSAWFAQQGWQPGDVIAILAMNRVEYIEVVLAAVISGVWIVPVNWHLTVGEIAHVLTDSGARAVIHDAALQHLLPRLSGVSTFDLADLCEAEGQVSWAGLITGMPGGIMTYTSGTTGKPKGVRRQMPATVSDTLNWFAQLGKDFGLDGRGCHLVTGPLYHAAPLLFALYDLINGAALVIMPRWDAAHALELIQQRQITHTHFVPTMFVRCLRLPPEARGRRLDSLSLVLHGAAPIAAPLKAEIIQWWGPILVEYWGGSEAGVVTRIESQEWQQHPGTVGRATSQYDVFALNDQGEVLAPGLTGLLYCRHRRFEKPFAYHGDPEKTAAAYHGTAYTLGDIGYVDADGYVFLRDRQSRMIISGGVNIYPQEVEQVLITHDDVVDVVVFGQPDDDWGESVVAAIEARGAITDQDRLQAELQELASQHLARYKCPRRWIFVDSLPRKPNGKVYLARLFEQLGLSKAL